MIEALELTIPKTDVDGLSDAYGPDQMSGGGSDNKNINLYENIKRGASQKYGFANLWDYIIRHQSRSLVPIISKQLERFEKSEDSNNGLYF